MHGHSFSIWFGHEITDQLPENEPCRTYRSERRTWYSNRMTPKLTDEMREALRDKSRQPVQVEDEQTHTRYVLLPLDVYQRVRMIFEEDFDISDTYAAQDEALAKVWDDPELDVYNDYDAHKRQPRR